jgi:hypothetical protein
MLLMFCLCSGIGQDAQRAAARDGECMHHASRGHRDLPVGAKFQHCGDDGVEFERAPKFDVLQHRDLRRAEAPRQVDALVWRHRHRVAIVRRDRHALAHHGADDVEHVVVGADLVHQVAGQRRHRVERHVAEQLDPDVEPDADRALGLEAGPVERAAHALQPLARRMVGLTEHQPPAARVVHLARRAHLGCDVHDAADDVAAIEVGEHGAVGVERAHAPARVRAGLAVEVPPWQAVDGRHDHCVLRDQRPQARQHGAMACAFSAMITRSCAANCSGTSLAGSR